METLIEYKNYLNKIFNELNNMLAKKNSLPYNTITGTEWNNFNNIVCGLRSTIYKELKTIQIREVNEKKLLIEQIQQLNEYLRNLEKDIYEENIFCNERKKLFDENIITEELFLEGEISYAYILKTYISTFWILLEKQLELYKLTNGYEEIINKILGEELWRNLNF